MHYEFEAGTVRTYHAMSENSVEQIRAMVQDAIRGKAEFSARFHTKDEYRVIAAGWTKANGEYTYSCDAWLK